jgi:hypothetical protein
MPLTLDTSLTPTGWSGRSELLDKTDFVTSGNGMGYPTVIKAAGRLSSPINTWYMWCSPHSPSALIHLATAPSPAGPWTPYNSGNPVLSSLPSGTADISAPFVLWNPSTSELWMWAHCLRTVDSRQPTWMWKSTDGITWTIQNSGNPVLNTVAKTNWAHGQTASYLTAIRESNAFRAYFQGVPDSATQAEVIGAQSTDGVNWAVMGNGNPLAASFDKAGGYDNGRPVPLKIAGRLSLYYASASGTTVENRVRQWLEPGWSDHFDPGFQKGANGTFDDHKAVFSDFVYDDGKIWGFYTGDTSSADTADEVVGVTSCTFSATGFDTTWGKG